MRKVLSLFVTLLFIATGPSYAGLFKDQSGYKSSDNNNSGYGNSGYNNSSSYASSNDYSGGLFRSSTDEDPVGRPGSGGAIGNTGGIFDDDDDPMGRPGSGDAIGQQAPLGDGLLVLIVCCVLLGFVKFFKGKRKIPC